MRTFKSANRSQTFLLPPNINDWIPEKHLARFIVDIVEQLDLEVLYQSYGHRGSTPYDPRMLLCLLVYGYSTGVFSSRKLEQSTYDSVAYRFLTGDQHPDHDTINKFRKRFLPEIEQTFTQILLIAKEMGLLKLGNISFDGTKVKAKASKHKAMSYKKSKEIEEQLKAEVHELTKQAEQADNSVLDDGLNIPDELTIRDKKLKKIKEAQAVIEARAEQRFEEEQKEYEEKIKKREDKEKKTGKKPKGRSPKKPEKGPKDKDQYNFTDPESRIMKTNDGFQQSYNSQAAVDHDSRLIVGQTLSNHTNDKQELKPTLHSIPDELGTPEKILADAGYFSQKNMDHLESKGIDGLIAVGRDHHNPPLQSIETKENSENQVELTPAQRMTQKLKTPAGKALYKLRKTTVEPVFGIIKEVLGFRRFSFKGIEKVRKEWTLVCTAYNLKRLFTMAIA